MTVDVTVRSGCVTSWRAYLSQIAQVLPVTLKTYSPSNSTVIWQPIGQPIQVRFLFSIINILLLYIGREEAVKAVSASRCVFVQGTAGICYSL